MRNIFKSLIAAMPLLTNVDGQRIEMYISKSLTNEFLRNTSIIYHGKCLISKNVITFIPVNSQASKTIFHNDSMARICIWGANLIAIDIPIKI
jgi:hypothetical protein